MKLAVKVGQRRPISTFPPRPHQRSAPHLLRRDTVRAFTTRLLPVVLCIGFLFPLYRLTNRSNALPPLGLDGLPNRPSSPTIDGMKRTTVEQRHLFSSAADVSSSRSAERAEALNYVRSFRQVNRRPLTFFHIPKAGGTAVEQAAGSQRISWGSCLFKHKPKRNICRYPIGAEWPKTVGWWHLPVQFFPLANSNPYQDAEIFAVVRDSYDRMVSEFHYICTLKVLDWRPDQCDRNRLTDKSYFNEWIQRKLNDREPDTAFGYLLDNGHFTPQYEYVMGPNDVRMVDYLLKLEQVDAQFPRLMEAFGLPRVKLEKVNALGVGKRKDAARLGVGDLDVDTRKLLHQLYSHDFENLGYQRKEVA